MVAVFRTTHACLKLDISGAEREGEKCVGTEGGDVDIKVLRGSLEMDFIVTQTHINWNQLSRNYFRYQLNRNHKPVWVGASSLENLLPNFDRYSAIDKRLFWFLIPASACSQWGLHLSQVTLSCLFLLETWNFQGKKNQIHFLSYSLHPWPASSRRG